MTPPRSGLAMSTFVRRTRERLRDWLDARCPACGEDLLVTPYGRYCVGCVAPTNASTQFDAFRGGFEAVYDGDVDEATVRKSYDEWVNR